MKLAVRTGKVDLVRIQLLSSLELAAEDIISVPTNYDGITLLNLNETDMCSSNSIRNIEALVLHEEAASELLEPTTASETPSFKSLGHVDEKEQYDHLVQLLYINKIYENNR